MSYGATSLRRISNPSLLHHLHHSNAALDNLLQQCITPHHLRQIHARILTSSSSSSAFLFSRLISVYARFELIFHAQNVFRTTPIECLSNTLLWNSVLRANVTNGCFRDALQVYVKMRQWGVLGDCFTFPLVLRACRFLGAFGLVCHDHVLQVGLQKNVHIGNELVGMYAKMGLMGAALKVFDEMPVRNTISWNTLVSGYALNFDCEGAIGVFRRMEAEGLEGNVVTWTSLLSSFARCGRLEEPVELFRWMRVRGVGAGGEAVAVVLSVCAELGGEMGRLIHGYVVKAGFENYLLVKNALISVYGKRGDVKGSSDLFAETEERNIVSWNALITSYAEAGLCDEVLEVFSELENDSMERPNVISWSAVIGAFAHKGRGEEALCLFHRMQVSKVAANAVTIASVVSVCAELAALNLGKEIHGHMVRAFMDSNILVENGLLNMYTKCGC